MTLKHQIAKIEDVAEPLRQYYAGGENGQFYLQVEGLVPKAKVDEFRNTNIELQRKLDAVKDIDPAEYTRLKEADAAKFAAAVAAATKKLGDEQIDAAVKTRTTQMVEQHNAALQERDQALGKATGMLSVAMIDNSVRAEAIKAGSHDTAVDDLVLRARNTFKLDNYNVVAMDPNGQKMFDADGTTPLSVSAWVKAQKKVAPHLFKGMDGGGAGGNGGRGGAGTDVSKLSATGKIQAGLDQLG